MARSSRDAITLKGSPFTNTHRAFFRVSLTENHLLSDGTVPPWVSQPPITTVAPSALASTRNIFPPVRGIPFGGRSGSRETASRKNLSISRRLNGISAKVPDSSLEVHLYNRARNGRACLRGPAKRCLHLSGFALPPWFTTTNLSYRFPIFETSATALCGTTGMDYIIIITQRKQFVR